jgi:hypothetical protein
MYGFNIINLYYLLNPIPKNKNEIVEIEEINEVECLCPQ